METQQQLFKILEALTSVFHHSQIGETLLDLHKASTFILSSYPHNSFLSKQLSRLTDSVRDLHSSKPWGLFDVKSFIVHILKWHEISRLVNSTELELHSLIDYEVVSSLSKTVQGLQCPRTDMANADKLFYDMSVLQDRVSRGFDINLQDLMLKFQIFSEIEWVLCNPLFSELVREKAAVLMKDIVLFNKHVFAGSVLVKGSVKELVTMGSLCSLHVLSSLVRAIRSPLVDEIESCGGILEIVCYLSSDSMEIRIMALNCLMEIGCYGREEVAGAMINSGLIEKLVELQRSGDEVEHDGNRKIYPFASCVARFATQLEVGEGLTHGEKKALKELILSKVRKACVSKAECATIVAELLWGSSPL